LLKRNHHKVRYSDALNLDRINADFDGMQEGITVQFAADHIPLTDVTWARVGDLRYVGQGYELKVPMPMGRMDGAAWRRFAAAGLAILSARIRGRGIRADRRR
jgi:hypothetical protein